MVGTPPLISRLLQVVRERRIRQEVQGVLAHIRAVPAQTEMGLLGRLVVVEVQANLPEQGLPVAIQQEAPRALLGCCLLVAVAVEMVEIRLRMDMYLVVAAAVRLE